MTTDTTRQLRPYPDLPLTVADTGEGRPVLVLHGGAGPASAPGSLTTSRRTAMATLLGVMRAMWRSQADSAAARSLQDFLRHAAHRAPPRRGRRMLLVQVSCIARVRWSPGCGDDASNRDRQLDVDPGQPSEVGASEPVP